MENNQNYLEELINSSIEKIRNLAETNTIIGDPIVSPTGKIIIPVSKVSVGFVVGGGQYNSITKKPPYPLAGGSGGGLSVTPIGFIVEDGEEVKFVEVEDKSAYQTVLNLANALINKLDKKGVKDEK